MSRSQRVSLLDMSRLVRIHAQLAELPAGSLEWSRHVAEAMNRLTPAQIVFVGEVRGFVPGGAPYGVRLFAEGWPSQQARLEFEAWAKLGDSLQTNPVQAALASSPKRMYTHRRIELVPDNVWHRAPIVNTLFRVTCVDDNLTAIYRLGGDAIFGLSAFRIRGDRPFTQRDRMLMHLLLSGVAPRFESARHTARVLADLPPRLAQTLELLLQGASEKQIAQRLDLSPHTIHDYIKSLHRRFGAASRSELLLAALGQAPPFPPSPPAPPTPMPAKLPARPASRSSPASNALRANGHASHAAACAMDSPPQTR